jgi:hypothetical protein
MSALDYKRTYSPSKLCLKSGGSHYYPVRWRNVLVFDRNYVAFKALLDSCHSALWLVCRCLPCISRDILVAHANR